MNTQTQDSTTDAGEIPLKTVSQAVKHLLGFIGTAQLEVIAGNCRGEEREFFKGKLVEYGNRIAAMPSTGETDELGDGALVQLHYFTAGADWWILEKDKGAPDDEPEQFQSQAFGLARIWEEEIGYISLPEILECGAELDLHFKPITLQALRQQLGKERAA